MITKHYQLLEYIRTLIGENTGADKVYLHAGEQFEITANEKIIQLRTMDSSAETVAQSPPTYDEKVQVYIDCIIASDNFTDADSFAESVLVRLANNIDLDGKVKDFNWRSVATRFESIVDVKTINKQLVFEAIITRQFEIDASGLDDFNQFEGNLDQPTTEEDPLPVRVQYNNP